MLKLKKGIQRRLPCMAVDAADFKTRVTDLEFDAVTVKYAKEGDNTLSTKTMNINNWVNLGEGLYIIIFTDTELDTRGLFIYNVTCDGVIPYPGAIQLIDEEIDETWKHVPTNDPQDSVGGRLLDISLKT